MNEFHFALKLNRLLLHKDVENKFVKYMADNITVEKVATYYKVASLFSLFLLYKQSLCYVERCFPMVADSLNFVNLDYNLVAKVVSRSELHIDSELQVYYALDKWLSHNIIERSKYAVDLMLKIRLSLLSHHALTLMLTKNSCFTMSEECTSIVKETLKGKKGLYSNNLSNKTRFCKQNKFNILVCGGEDVLYNRIVSNVNNINANHHYSVSMLPQMKEDRKSLTAVCAKDEVYVFGGNKRRLGFPIKLTSVEKYSLRTNKWTALPSVLNRYLFCACSLMGNIYVIGGSYYKGGITNTCFQLSTEDYKWRKVAKMNEPRFGSACLVFEGKIVVSGGTSYLEGVNTVEAYDHVAKQWTYMPNMIEIRSSHKAVAMKNKFFVVGGLFNNNCEVFDSTCNTFVILRPPSEYVRKFLWSTNEVVSIGSNLVVFGDRRETILFYDVETDKWSEKSFELTRYLEDFSCVKLPQL